MYVCVCQAVTESQVREAVRNGARSVRALRERLGVASGCGVCIAYAFGIIKEGRRGQDREDRAACPG